MLYALRCQLFYRLCRYRVADVFNVNREQSPNRQENMSLRKQLCNFLSLIWYPRNFDTYLPSPPLLLLRREMRGIKQGFSFFTRCYVLPFISHLASTRYNIFIPKRGRFSVCSKWITNQQQPKPGRIIPTRLFFYPLNTSSKDKTHVR